MYGTCRIPDQLSSLPEILQYLMRAQLHQCYQRILTEVAQPTINLRFLVGHTNMIDDLRSRCELQASWARVCKDIRMTHDKKRVDKKVASVLCLCFDITNM